MTTTTYEREQTIPPGIPTEVDAEQLRGSLATSLHKSYCAAFAEQYLEGFTQDPVPDWFAETAEQNGGIVVVIENKDREIIAAAAGYQTTRGAIGNKAETYVEDPNSPTFWIDEVLVTPDNQGLGFGSQIFDALIRTAVDNGNTHFSLRTASIDNDIAIGLYERRGFIDNGWRSNVTHLAASKTPGELKKEAERKQITVYEQDGNQYVCGERLYMEMEIESNIEP